MTIERHARFTAPLAEGVVCANVCVVDTAGANKPDTTQPGWQLLADTSECAPGSTWDAAGAKWRRPPVTGGVAHGGTRVDLDPRDVRDQILAAAMLEQAGASVLPLTVRSLEGSYTISTAADLRAMVRKIARG